MKKLLPALRLLLFTVIGVAFMYFMFRKQNMEELFGKAMEADFRWILLSMLCGVLAHMSRAIRWNLLLEPMGYKARPANCYYSVMIGYLVNYTIPRSGEVARCAVLSRTDKIPVQKLVGTVLIERIFDLVIMLAIVVLTFVLQFDLLDDFYHQYVEPMFESGSGKVTFLIWAVVALVAMVLIFLVLRKTIMQSKLYQKFSHLVHGFIDGIRSITRMKRPMLFIAHSLFIWSMYYMMGYFIFFSIDATSHLGFAAGLTTLVMASIGVIIPIPGGLGVLGTISMGLMLYGIEQKPDGMAYAGLSYAAQTIMIFVVGGFSWLMVLIGERRRNKKVTMSDITEVR